MAPLLEAALPLKPDERAMVLEESKELEAAYASVARKGDTQAPDNPEDEVDFHYMCFVKSHKDGHLYQLDGMKRPIDLGPMKKEDDVLSEVCLSVIRGLVQEATRDKLHFSLMALAPAQD
jgi:ubiquitin carboxyl-terminal hydrolase L3